METEASGLSEITSKILPLDEEWIEKARRRTAQLVMPTRALGRLHEIAETICAIRETLTPTLKRKAVLIMAGDHGVASAGVSAYPQEVTGAMVGTFLGGGAGISAIARHVGADVRVVDMGIIPRLDPGALEGGRRLWVHKLAPGTANMAAGPAMTRSQAEQALQTGFDCATRLFNTGVDVLGTGDMGIGNTTPSAAIGAVITGTGLDVMVGPGTGLDATGVQTKREMVQRALDVNRPDRGDGIDLLAKVGGFEIGGIAGSILAAAHYRRPVVVDGFISTAGALIAQSLCPAARGYMFAGHRSQEPGHQAMLEHLGLAPVLDLGMRLGEGTGGCLAMGVMEAAVQVFREVWTFEQAGVADKD